MDAQDDVFASRYPAIHEWLTVRALDGKRVETATLLLFTEDGAFKACLSDREQGLVSFRSGLTVEALLDGLEGALAAGTAEWREKRERGAARRG